MDTKKLRQKILDLAIHGKLVPQDPNDEPASVLLERIRKEKEQLIKEGKIKSPKKSKSAGDTSHYPKEGPWEVPEGWCWTCLGDIFLHNTGKALNAADREGRLLKYITTSNLYWDRFELSVVKEMLFTEDELDKCTAKKGDLLVCEGGDIGRAAIWDQDYDIRIQNHIHKLRGLGHINHRLFMFWLMFMKADGLIGGKGIGLMGLSSRELDRLLVPLPPLKEQNSLVDRIDTLFKVISNLEQVKGALAVQITAAKTKILDFAIHGKLVPQYPSDEPAIELLKRINPAFKPSDNLHYGGSLPTGWVCATYGALNQHRNRSINPMDSPKEQYELYSVPIYDTGYPEYLTGKEIGSTKQAVEKGDVLLCKINPHLNRAWVVEHYNPMLKCIASSEWLIFQSDALCPDYTRLFFMSPEFRSLMLSNVSGVGGSLMRARASAVDGYPIWVPPIDEQKRIVKVVKAYYKVLDEIVAGPS